LRVLVRGASWLTLMELGRNTTIAGCWLLIVAGSSVHPLGNIVALLTWGYDTRNLLLVAILIKGTRDKFEVLSSNSGLG